MTKYRKALNRVLKDLIQVIQPIMEKYEKMCSGVKNEYILEQESLLKEKMADLKEIALEEAEAVYLAYLKRLEKKAKSITGGDIDKGDIVLLETSLYTLNQEEFDVLQDKYEGNRAMERLLSGYADKRGTGIDPVTGNIDPEHSLTCRFLTDKQKINLAEQLYKELTSWIGNNEGFGVSEYVLQMAGDMFVAADKLKE